MSSRTSSSVSPRPTHDTRLSGDATLSDTLQHREALVVGRYVAHRGRETADGLEVVRDDLGLTSDDLVDVVQTAVEVGDEDLDSDLRRRATDGFDGTYPVPCAVVLESSRSTLVMTACFRPIFLMLCATFIGSRGSRGAGAFPERVLQKRQARVQTAPPIMKVAVPALQHSPWLGHRPLWQMVLSPWCSIVCFVSVKVELSPRRIFSHSGLRTRTTLPLFFWVIGSSCII